MKRLIALVLMLLLVFTGIPVFAADTQDSAPEAAEIAAYADTAADTAADSELPSSCTLVGSSALPPVGNQGGVGSCASEAIAYMQFTNAVARYMNAAAPNAQWNPSSGAKEYLFSPKYTYTLSGSGTQWVYDTLRDHGCLTWTDSAFYKDAEGGSQYSLNGQLIKSAVKWDVENDLMQKALSYRLKNYEQIWVAGNNGKNYINTETPKVNGVDNVEITTGESGRALLHKIKDALNRGNAVVTGGYISRWVTGYLTGDGEIGKAGQAAIVASAGAAPGGHQVTIIGYDDKIECTIAGNTMKGGFLVVNSWGEGWGTDGCEWLMYDALNTVSEFDDFNKEGFYSGDMYIDAMNDTSIVMNPIYSATGDQTVTFTKVGTVTLSGKTYPTYTLYSKALGGYLSYSLTTADHSLHVEKAPGTNTAWAFIPYEDVTSWKSTSSAYKDESYNGSYWVYAAGRSKLGTGGYAYLDAGLSYTSSGRSVGIASHNSGNYPVAKSWYVEMKEGDSFQSSLGIWDGRGESLDRCWTMDQFCFTYWDKDITLEKPELYISVDITTNNREAVYMQLVRQPKDVVGSSGRSTFTPASSTYYSVHPTYDISGGWNTEGNRIGFSGTVGGGEETVTAYFSYSTLLYNLSAGTTLSDYKWGVRFCAKRKTDVTYSNVKLLSQDGKVLAQLDLGEDGIVTVAASKNSSMTTTSYGSYLFFSPLPEDSYKAATGTTSKGIIVTPITEGELHYGDSCSFRVETAKNYVSENLTVCKNGVPLYSADGVYTTIVCGDIEITAAADVRPLADMNDDKEATIADVTAMLTYLAGNGKLAENAIPDLTGDGKVTVKDVTRLLLFLENEEITLVPGTGK